MSPIRPVRSSDSGGRRISPRLRSCGACAVPGDGVYGFPRSLAHTIEPRAPIGKLGFTEGYPLLEIGENMQERVSMHAAVYDDAYFVGVNSAPLPRHVVGRSERPCLQGLARHPRAMSDP